MERSIYKKINCPICNSGKYNFHYNFGDKKPPFKMVKCLECSLVYMNPQIREEYLYKIYSDEQYYSGGLDYTYSDERKERKSTTIIYNSILESIEKKVKIGKILDIGCSFGGFLETAKRRGWDVFGVDVSEFAIKYLKEKNISCFRGNIEDSNLKNNSFDCITMFETIEHLSNPKKTVSFCFSLLKGNGLFIAQTGNVESLFSKIKGKNNDYYLPGHLVYFSDKNLISLFKKIGFSKFYLFAGDDIKFIDRLKAINSTTNVNSLAKVGQMIKWFIFYFMRMIFLNKPILGSITVYARK